MVNPAEPVHMAVPVYLASLNISAAVTQQIFLDNIDFASFDVMLVQIKFIGLDVATGVMELNRSNDGGAQAVDFVPVPGSVINPAAANSTNDYNIDVFAFTRLIIDWVPTGVAAGTIDQVVVSLKNRK